VANSFSGFTPDAFAFFQELSQHNNKAWFDQNRGRYEEHVTGAFRGLLETLTPCCGRDAGCPAPPAQIRTSSATAYGSYRRCLASNRKWG
jgi:uncharacterized protein (DUF2461 family)